MVKKVKAKAKKSRSIVAMTKQELINRLLADYFKELYDLAKSNPEVFGDDKWASENPKDFAIKQSENYKDALTKKKVAELRVLYREHIQDQLEIAAELEKLKG